MTWLRRGLPAALACMLGLGPACDSDAGHGTPADQGGTSDAPAETGGDAPSGDTPSDAAPDPGATAAAAVSATTLRTHIDFLASDETAGRITGSPGHLAARDYVAEQLEAAGLEAFGDDGTWLDEYATGPFDGRFQRNGDGSIAPNDATTAWNVVGILRGTDLAEQYVVVMAHYDHLGVSADGEDIYNGAFDDASGVAAVIEVARVLVEADATPRRSIVFLVTDQEEVGLTGAGQWLADPPVPLESIVAGISADPVGRGLLPDYGPIVLIGLERSPQLMAFWRQTEAFTVRPVGYLHRAMIPLFASDQDRFYDRGIPAMWLTSPGMSFYHMHTDDPDTIDYTVLREVTRYLTLSALLVANTDETFAYEGATDLAIENARDAAELLAGVLESTYPSENEKAQVQTYVDRLQEVIDAESWDAISNPLLFFGEALAFVAFQLPRNYPGPIPPPFPED